MKRPPADAVSIELEVPFHHVDALQVVWHGHYLKYMEAARAALIRSKELDAQDVVDLGYLWLVAESRCRHTFPLRYGERFRVTAWFGDIDNRIRVVYEIWNLTQDRRSAKGHTILVTTTLDGKLVLATPEEIRRRILG